MANTPNMLLDLPDVTVTPGPEWADKLNTALEIVDDHDHTGDKGKKVPISGVDINQDLDMQQLEIVDTKAVNFKNLSSTLSGALNVNKFHIVSGNVWFTNSGGTPVQITDGNSIVSTIVVPSSPLMPAGVILDYAGPAASVGFLLCDGSAISRTTYSDLFAAIGTTWGVGDGFTTFNLPNLNGRTTIGNGTYTDSVSGSITRTIGQSLGSEAHVLTLPQIPSHNHGGGNHTHPIRGTPGQGVDAGNADDLQAPTTVIANTDASGVIISTEGGGLSHNNMQPSAVVVKMIKT
jgi:microcystin-dependent protein